MSTPVLPPITPLQPMGVEPYRRYLPSAYDNGLSFYETLTNILEYLHLQGKLFEELLRQWEEVSHWIMNDGLTEAVKKKLDEMYKDGELQILINQLIETVGYNLKWFGADGTKVKDQLAWTKVLDFITTKHPNGQDGGATIWIPHGTFYLPDKISGYKHVTVTGNGILRGSVIVEMVPDLVVAGSNADMYFTFKGLQFKEDVNYDKPAITFRNMQKADVIGCKFENYQVGVLGKSTTDLFLAQQTQRVHIEDCRFRNCVYGVKTEYIPYVPGQSPSTWRYSQHGDWKVSNCYIESYSRGKDNIHFEGMDGFIISNNYCFMPLYSLKNPEKLNNIYLEQTNFGVVNGNDLFEAGEYAIKSLNQRSLIISSNNCAWGGQRMEGGGIYIETVDRSTFEEHNVIISNNNITFPTRFGIHGGYSTTNVHMNNNVITKTGDLRFYYGPDISNQNKYSIFYGTNPTPFAEMERVSSTDNMYDGLHFQYRGYSRNFNKKTFDDKEYYGVFRFLSEDLVDNLSLQTIGSRQVDTLNTPLVLKNVNGKIGKITNGWTGMIITLIVGEGKTLTLDNTGTGDDTLHIGKQIILNQSDYITLQKTNSYWIKLGGKGDIN